MVSDHQSGYSYIWLSKSYRVRPFDSTAIKPYVDTCDHDVSDVTPSTSSSDLSHHTRTVRVELKMQKEECKVHGTIIWDADVEIFQRRFDDGYNNYDIPRR